MQARYNFPIIIAVFILSLMSTMPVFAKNSIDQPTNVTAVTEVLGDGVHFSAISIKYDEIIDGNKLTKSTFKVSDRTITDIYTSITANPKDKAESGHFVIIKLSLSDPNALLAEKVQSQQGSSTKPFGGNGPGNAGDIPPYDTIYKQPQADLVQLKAIITTDGKLIPASNTVIKTNQVENLIVDDFKQLEFYDAKTNKTLRYNLFIPKDYDPNKSYPLVLFMHDAGATSDVTRTTLLQGLGAVIWASSDDQAKHPAFVLAPQYDEIIADDDSKTSSMLDTTIDLINSLTETYNIDHNRLYTTGQSGGCMMSIAMNIKYPDFFAASFLVAGQWDPTLVKPLAKQKLWILLSQDDNKAFPGQNAITQTLKENGAKISTATWDGRWDAAQFSKAYKEIVAENSPINYVTFAKGTVIPEGESSAGASGHRNTWRIAYTIEPIREWIFQQHK